MPVLELAFVRDVPVLVRGFLGARTKTGIRAHRASSSTGICQIERGFLGARTKTGIYALHASSSTGLCQF